MKKRSKTLNSIAEVDEVIMKMIKEKNEAAPGGQAEETGVAEQMQALADLKQVVAQDRTRPIPRPRRQDRQNGESRYRQARCPAELVASL